MTRRGIRYVLSISAVLTVVSGCAFINRAPVAVISVSTDSGIAPLEVQLSGEGSYDPDGSVVRYEWTMGDGTTAASEQLSHVYDAPVNYLVVLRVTDNDGAVGTDEVLIRVTRLDLTGEWTGVIREDKYGEPYALDLMLWQQRSDNSLSGTVEWSTGGYGASIPIVRGYVTGTDVDIVASGICSPDPRLLPYVWYSIHLEGHFEDGILQGTGSWDEGLFFHWAAWQ